MPVRGVGRDPGKAELAHVAIEDVTLESWEAITNDRVAPGAGPRVTPFWNGEFVKHVLCLSDRHCFQLLQPLPRGRYLRALREAVGPQLDTLAGHLALPVGHIRAIEDEEDGRLYPQDPNAYSEATAVGNDKARVTYQGVCALYGAMQSYLDWRAEQGHPLDVVERPTTAEVVADELAQVEAGRAADPHYDRRRIAEAAFDDGHSNWLDVHGRFRGGWSNDNGKNVAFVQTFTPALVLSLLDEIAELKMPSA